MDEQIKAIRKILRFRKRPDLAELLLDSQSNIEQSSSYGSALFSVLSTFEIYSPIQKYEKLKILSKDDLSEIYNAVSDLYPVKDNSIEIANVEFHLSMNSNSEYDSVESKELQNVGFEYIRDQIVKCEEKISNLDFEGAISNSRTLVESVCSFILEESRIKFKRDGNLIKLHKEVSKVLEMDPSKFNHGHIKQILSGFISIINGLSSLRNDLGDSHGKTQQKYFKPSERHAILAVNSAKVISNYILASWNSKK